VSGSEISSRHQKQNREDSKIQNKQYTIYCAELSIDGANLCYSLGSLGECRETFIEQIKVNYLSKNEGTEWIE
jgi:hypothetical protein